MLNNFFSIFAQMKVHPFFAYLHLSVCLRDREAGFYFIQLCFEKSCLVYLQNNDKWLVLNQFSLTNSYLFLILNIFSQLPFFIKTNICSLYVLNVILKEEYW